MLTTSQFTSHLPQDCQIHWFGVSQALKHSPAGMTTQCPAALTINGKAQEPHGAGKAAEEGTVQKLGSEGPRMEELPKKSSPGHRLVPREAEQHETLGAHDPLLCFASNT